MSSLQELREQYIQFRRETIKAIESESSSNAEVTKISKKAVDALFGLRKTKEGQNVLVSLLRDEDNDIASGAATALLEIDPETALPVLERISKAGGIAGADAVLGLAIYRNILSTDRYKEIKKRVREVVNRNDPDNLISIGAPDDEYNSQTDQIVGLIFSKKFNEQTLRKVFSKAARAVDYVEFANEILKQVSDIAEVGYKID